MHHVTAPNVYVPHTVWQPTAGWEQFRKENRKPRALGMTGVLKVDVQNSVTCPKCQAARGEPCLSKLSRPATSPHTERMRAHAAEHPDTVSMYKSRQGRITRVLEEAQAVAA